jgi:ABC-type transport system involved in cytochrome bd biosynthesis fused ATPase/permease subunit
MDHETVDTLLNKIAAVLEEHTLILVNHRQNIEQIFKEVVLVKERLQKLESSDSDKSVDADFIAEMNARLEAISNSLRAKG